MTCELGFFGLRGVDAWHLRRGGGAALRAAAVSSAAFSMDVQAFCVARMSLPRRANWGTRRMVMDIRSASVGVRLPSVHSTLSDVTMCDATENASRTFASMSPWQAPYTSDSK